MSNFVGWPMHVPETQSLILFWPWLVGGPPHTEITSVVKSMMTMAVDGECCKPRTKWSHDCLLLLVWFCFSTNVLYF